MGPVTSSIDDYFFFSYARKDETNPAEDYAELIYHFFQELRQAIRDLVREDNPALLRDADRVGFIDRELPLGANYIANLPAALQRCKSIVCLYSSRYFTRMICGQEAQVFLDRVSNHGKNPEIILPLFWEPPDDLSKAIPSTMAAYQFVQQPGFPFSYRQHGLRELLVKDMVRDYRAVAAALAKAILTANELNVAPLPVAPNMDTYPMAFPEILVPSAAVPAGAPPDGPQAVRFVYVASTSPAWAWTPFPPVPPAPPPPADPIGKLAVGIAMQRGFFPDRLDLAPNVLPPRFIDELAEAKRNNTPVVLLIDPRTLQLTTYYNLLDAYDDINYLNCAALIVWDSNPALTAAQRLALENLVGTVFDDSLARTSQFFLDDIRSPKDLAERLPKVLDDLQTNVRSKGARRREVPGSGSALPVI
jgi:TIR domain-containing protein